VAEPKDVVRHLVDAYNAKSLERLKDLYHPDAFFWDVFHRDGVRGRDAITKVLNELFEMLPDERMHIQTLAADERHAVAEFRSTGTAAGGRPFELEFTEVYEIEDGRIASCRVYVDPEEVPDTEPTSG
jgi:ketosteroid isomerase-like protein